MLSSSQIPKNKNPFKEKITKSQEILFRQQYLRQKPNKQIANNNMPISIYNTCISQNQTNPEFSVKLPKAYKMKLDTNNIISNSPFQQNVTNKFFSPQNLTNSYSDLCTSASFSSQKSSESFFSSNNNTNNQILQKNIVLMPKNLNMYNSSKKNIINVNYSNDLTKNCFYNNNLTSKDLANIINNSQIINQKNQNLASINLNNSNNLLKEITTPNYINFNNNTINTENNYFKGNYFNTQKSIDLTEQNISIHNGIDYTINSKANSINNSSKSINYVNNNTDNQNRKKSKNYYNKFNTARENSMNENTVILTLKIKVGKNDYRYFNLKKYDDLFVSLEKFVDLNKIKQELVKPMVAVIFKALNTIFFILNNKIGIYDQEYLNSLYKLWIKNNQKIPKMRNKNHSDKSTTSSSDSSSETSYKDIKSNSYQNTDGNSSDEKGSQHTSKSF